MLVPIQNHESRGYILWAQPIILPCQILDVPWFLDIVVTFFSATITTIYAWLTPGYKSLANPQCFSFPNCLTSVSAFCLVQEIKERSLCVRSILQRSDLKEYEQQALLKEKAMRTHSSVQASQQSISSLLHDWLLSASTVISAYMNAYRR